MSTDFRPRTPIPMADLEQRRIYDEIGLGEFEEQHACISSSSLIVLPAKGIFDGATS
jgi:hypothetical protein